jgi:putative membrane protein
MKSLFGGLFLVLLSYTVSAQQAEVNNSKIRQFITKAAYATMLAAQEGKLASEKGSAPEVRAYGDLLKKDQSLFLGELQKLADIKHLELPTRLSNKRNTKLKKLASKSGAGFDSEFLKQTKIAFNHEVKQVKFAIESEDTELAAFAEKFLPLLQDHLAKVKKLLNE